MQCQHARDLFSDYVSETLETAFQVTLENHLATCASCREEVEGVQQVWKALEAAPLVEPPMFFHENVMARFDTMQVEAEQAAARKSAVWDWRALFRPRALSFAAAALILLLACIEVVQTQRAQIGPIGFLIQWLHPTAPPVVVKAVSAEWTPKAEGGGTLAVNLKASHLPSSEMGLSIPAEMSLNGNKEATANVIFKGEQTTAVFALNEKPTANVLQGSVTLDLPEGKKILDLPSVTDLSP